jgi:hypothetical protein
MELPQAALEELGSTPGPGLFALVAEGGRAQGYQP